MLNHLHLRIKDEKRRQNPIQLPIYREALMQLFRRGHKRIAMTEKYSKANSLAPKAAVMVLDMYDHHL